MTKRESKETVELAPAPKGSASYQGQERTLWRRVAERWLPALGDEPGPLYLYRRLAGRDVYQEVSGE